MILDDKYQISDRIVLIIACICIAPFFLNMIGLDFGTLGKNWDPYYITQFSLLEQQDGIRNILNGRNVNTILTSFCITISLITAFLAYVDYHINKEPSTPVVATALLCSGIFLIFHILVSLHMIPVEGLKYYFTSYTWLFTRIFHSGILILGTAPLLFFVHRKNKMIPDSFRILGMVLIGFLVLTFLVIGTLLYFQNNVSLAYPFKNVARSLDILPLLFYIVLAVFLLPSFSLKFPSDFSRSLLISMAPALVAQFYMVFGSQELFDNSYNISHFLMAISFLIPLAGLVLNYVSAHKKERASAALLRVETKDRLAYEQLLKAVLDSSMDAIISLESVQKGEINIEYRITAINRRFSEMFPRPTKTRIGENIFSAYPDMLEEGWPEIFIYVMKTGTAETREYFSPSTGRWLFQVVVPLKQGITMTITDITQRKISEQELLLSEKISMSGRMARIIAHEVRNPLTNIKLASDQLSTEMPAEMEEQNEFLKIIRRNAERINDLITELLQSSRPSELIFSEISAGTFLDEIKKLAADRAGLKGAEIIIENKVTDETIYCDKSKFELAVFNLVINAIEAIADKEGRITISAESEEEHFLFRISDNGPGIAPEIMKRLFEPFNTGKRSGMGLGLTSVQNIIQAHKGVLCVEKTGSGGTTFLIRLPKRTG